MRQHGVPLLIESPDHPAAALEPLLLEGPPFQEDKLQALLAAHPAVLPVAEIEPAFAPLICLGREIRTPSGSLDVLYVSPLGRLTLVEAKLWENPQARREVVGQIVEYAKDFSRWTFEELDHAVRRAGGPASSGILDAIREHDPDIDEAAFIDTVTRQLHRGAFLLLVVGNGIREGVETLTAYLQRTPSLHFSLALVELALYRVEQGQDWPLLVQPRTVARTAEIVRAVVEVHAPPELQVTVALPPEEETQKARSRRTLTEESFFEQLAANTSPAVAAAAGELITQLRDLGVEAHWRASSVSLRLPDIGDSGRYWTVVVLTVSGTFLLGWLTHVTRYGGYDPSIWRYYLARVKQLTSAKASGKEDDATTPAPLGHLLDHSGEFVTLVQSFIEDLQAAVRSAEV